MVIVAGHGVGNDDGGLGLGLGDNVGEEYAMLSMVLSGKIFSPSEEDGLRDSVISPGQCTSVISPAEGGSLLA